MFHHPYALIIYTAVSTEPQVQSMSQQDTWIFFFFFNVQ